MQPHRSSALGYASAASAAHSRVYGACAAEAAASETSGLSVGGCPGARGYFGPLRCRPSQSPESECLGSWLLGNIKLQSRDSIIKF